MPARRAHLSAMTIQLASWSSSDCYQIEYADGNLNLPYTKSKARCYLFSLMGQVIENPVSCPLAVPSQVQFTKIFHEGQSRTLYSFGWAKMKHSMYVVLSNDNSIVSIRVLTICVLRLWPRAKYSHSNDLLKHHRDPTQVNTEAATSSAQCQWFLWAHHRNPLFGLVIRLVMTCDPPSREETAWQRLWKERGSVLCVGSRPWRASWNCYSLLVPTQSANNETAM